MAQVQDLMLLYQEAPHTLSVTTVQRNIHTKSCLELLCQKCKLQDSLSSLPQRDGQLVLASVGIEFIFFQAADKMTCFGLRMRIMLITH